MHSILQKLAEFWKKLSPYILCFLKWLIQKLKEKLQDMEDHYQQVNLALLLTIDESLELVKTLSGHPYESPVFENMQFDHYVAVSNSISAAGKAPRYSRRRRHGAVSTPPGAKRASITPLAQTRKHSHEKPINRGFAALSTLFAVSAQSEQHKGEEKKMPNRRMNDTQRNAFQLTINNPVKSGYDHARIKETLITGFSTLRYFCMADEMGERGTYHTHIYVYFNSRVRFSTIKKRFETAHIEAAEGTPENNLDYIRKSGKWEDTAKKETSIEGMFEEWGDFPTQKGQDSDMHELYEMVKNGYSNAEILAINNDYILQIDKLDKLRTMLLTEKYKDERRLDLKVVYVSGETGTGKTRGILDKHGDSKVYRVTDYEHPFDGYSCQPVIAFDEYRSQLKLADMLNYCDIYPIELPARYANKYACYDTVYIVSNQTLEEQYIDEQTSTPTSWAAFLRRIHEVHVYTGIGEVILYHSTAEYLNRVNGFTKLPEARQLELPFQDED